MKETSVFHDTYYVVAHGRYLISLLVLFLAAWALWALAQRWSDTNLRRPRRATALVFLLGCVLAIMPMAIVSLTAGREISSALAYFQWASRAALFGMLFITVAGLTTLLVFIRTVIRRIRS